jgi:hypothetical protein
MSNAAAAGPVSRFDRIDDDEAEDQPFWLYDPDGVPVVIPSTCVGFQVRFWSPNQRGLGTIVTDTRNGRPLILPRNVSPDEFAERVGYRVGRYRLFLLDGAHQRMHIDPGQIEITPEMAAARRGDLSTDAGASMATTTAEPSGAVLGQVLAFVKESHAHALDQIASLQRDLAESQRQTAAQLATVVGAVSGVLSAAGSSGLVKKTTALDAAAAGAPVTVQMVPSSTGAPSNNNEAPRNAATTTTTTAAAATAAAEKSGVADALMALGMPLIEKLAPVAAYGMAQKMDVPEEVARDLAGFVKTATQTAGAMMKADAEAATAADAATATAATVGLGPRVGAELLAHVLRIQGALSEDERAWVASTMAKAPGLLDALKPSVAALTVEEGTGAVRALRAIDAAMSTENERRLFGYMLKPEVLPTVFRPVLVDRTTEEAIEYVRARAAQMGE